MQRILRSVIGLLVDRIMSVNAVPLMLVPITEGVDLATIQFKLKNLLESSALSTRVFTPILDDGDNNATCAPEDVLSVISITKVESLLAANRRDRLLDEVVSNFTQVEGDADFVIVSGIELSPNRFYASRLNFQIAQALSAVVIFVGFWHDVNVDRLDAFLNIAMNDYSSVIQDMIAGCIVISTMPDERIASLVEKCQVFQSGKLRLLTLGWEEVGTVVELLDFLKQPYESRVTPTIFYSYLIKKAKELNKKIILPEGSELRTLKAANFCVEHQIAQCVLLGNEQEILATARRSGITLSPRIVCIDPVDVTERYVDVLVELRRHRGMTADSAKELLKDNVVLGTMMLYMGEVDGLVSGALHTTADVVRPALQIIKTMPGAKLVSAAFFVCLADQVLLYADCAVNQNPTAEDLADIAIQSADSARIFGLPVRIAFLSYSTGDSASGPDVDKVSAAVEIARIKRPDLIMDGPLQYDAAITREVMMLKAPGSLVGGEATVFIFPNLDSGNIAYKAVQRSADVVCIGPILQGLRKPVNDLSRGCVVEDIIFTIAVTAVQAG